MKYCELCKGLARTYCDSDQASLCWNCDSKVHSANFLVARHSRTVLCHACYSLTPWKASGAEIGVTVSVCQKCVFGAKNRFSDEDSKRGVNCYEFEDGEDDDNDDYYEEEDEELSDTDEDGDNQVVPWSSSLAPPPPSSSSSCSEDSNASLTNGGVEGSREPSAFSSRMMRGNTTSGFSPQDDLRGSSYKRKYSSESTFQAHLVCTDGEETSVDNLRPNKDRKVDIYQTGQSQSGPGSDSLVDSLRRLHKEDTRQLCVQCGPDQS